MVKVMKLIFQVITKKIKSEFDSLKDIINYIEGQYESYVIPTSINFLEKARTHK